MTTMTNAIRPRIYESHIDLVLAEAFRSPLEFSRHFVEEVAAQIGMAIPFDEVRVRRQVPHSSVRGSADLVVELVKNRSITAELIIENKLEAGFTRDQAARYAASKQARIVAKMAPIIATVLVCPSIYRIRSRHATGFDAVITYEDLAHWLNATEQQTIAAALLRASLPYEAEDVPEVSSFFDGYRRIAAEVAPELLIKPNPNSNNARPNGSTTIYFAAGRILTRPRGLPTLRFSHQCLDNGAPSVKVMLAGWARHAAALSTAASRDLQGTGFYIRPAGASLGIVANTPRLGNTQSTEAQRGAIIEGLQAASRLLAWFNANEATLSAWVDYLSHRFPADAPVPTVDTARSFC